MLERNKQTNNDIRKEKGERQAKQEKMEETKGRSNIHLLVKYRLEL
jgi:hypothetical protein